MNLSNSKKQTELEVLNQTIKIGIDKGTAETRRILSLFDCNDVEDHCECPDFVRFNADEHLLLGIEHFRVDHFITEIKDKRVGSTGVMYKKDISNAYNKWREEVLNSEVIPDGSVEDLMKTVERQLERSFHATYSNFIHSFCYTLNKHLDRLDNYWDKLRKLQSESQEIRMAFLIEVYCDFRKLFLSHYNRTHQNKEGFMPFFKDVVDSLKSVDTSKVHYFILCLKTYDETSMRSYAFESSKFEYSFNQQGLKIYEYSGIDYLLDPFNSLYRDMNFSSSHCIHDHQIDLKFKLSPEFINPQIHDFLLMNSVKQALYYKRLDKPYACDKETQTVVYVYGDHIANWKYDSTGQYVYEPIMRYMSARMIQEREKKFKAMFSD